MSSSKFTGMRMLKTEGTVKLYLQLTHSLFLYNSLYFFSITKDTSIIALKWRQRTKTKVRLEVTFDGFQLRGSVLSFVSKVFNLR